jgi:hypothetical protein
MASLSIPTATSTLPMPPVPVPPALPVGAVAAALPAVLPQAEAEALALPASQPAPGLAQGGDAAPSQDGAAMRPDQLAMSRQLVWATRDGAALAASWRGLTRNYGAQVAARERLARDSQLPAALLQSGQDPRVLRQADQAGAPQDAWRFTVHANGTRDQHLRVLAADDASSRQKRRRPGRAALRLELVLDDGTVVTVEALQGVDGIGMELCAPDLATASRLRRMQPQLEEAMQRAGLHVRAWTFRDTLPSGQVHARLPSAEAVEALGLPVFRAMAELALLLPAAPFPPLA